MNIPMTVEGYKALDEELKHLKSVERPSIVQAIAEARSHGDLSENAEYHAAKEKQGFIESRVLEIESRLAHAQIIDIKKLSGDHIKFGATVTIYDEDTEEEHVYKIVGEDEANVKFGKISISSPIARALIGKSLEDIIEVSTPGGLKSYEILNIDWI